jgi:hypothetical protein
MTGRITGPAQCAQAVLELVEGQLLGRVGIQRRESLVDCSGGVEASPST